MKKLWLLVIVGFGSTGLCVNAQEKPTRLPARLEAISRTTSVDRGDDEKAIKSLLDTFIRAFNAGDPQAVASTYTETAIVVDEQGEVVEGRPAIREQYTRSFADNPGATIFIQTEALRFLGPETAMEEGRTTIKPAKSDRMAELSRFTTVYVKLDGKWLQSAVRDEVSRDLIAHDHLKDLEWLVGDWVNESQDAVVTTSCKWAIGGNFLEREFTMKTKGHSALTGSQRIGWDPLKRQFKTWVFEVNGGHGEGYWTRNGDQWLIKIEGVRYDGLPVTATNVIIRLGKDRLGWQSTDRTLSGLAVAGIDDFVVVRTPPAAGK